MGFTVTPSYVTVTITYQGGESGWKYDYELNETRYQNSTDSSKLFSGLSQGTTYTWSASAKNANGDVIETGSGIVTTKKNAPNATFSAEAIGAQVTAKWSNFQPVNYERELDYELYKNGVTDPITGYTSFVQPYAKEHSVNFDSLANGTYSVKCKVYNIENPASPILIRTEQVNGLVIDQGASAVFSASVSEAGIIFTWSNIQTTGYEKRIETKIYFDYSSGTDPDGYLVVDSTDVRISGATSSRTEEETQSKNGTYKVVSKIYNATNDVLLKSAEVTGLIISSIEVPEASLFAQGDSMETVEATLTDIPSLGYSRNYVFEIYDGSTLIDTMGRTKAAWSSGDLGVRFSGLEPSTVYDVVCYCEESGERYEATARTFDKLATLHASANSTTDITVMLTDLVSQTYARTYVFDLLLDEVVIDTARSSKTPGQKSGVRISDIILSFSNLKRNTEYEVVCSCEESLEKYSVNVTTLSADPAPPISDADVSFLGKNYESFEKHKKSTGYSQVVIKTGQTDEDDNDIVYIAGDESGLTLEISNPFGTQVMARAILDQVRGYEYQPYEVTNGLLDPAAEIGDGINVSGVRSGIYGLNQDFGLILTSDIFGEKIDEDDEEYKYTPKSERSYARTISELKTQFIIQNGLIESKISLDDAETMIQQTLESITLSATNGTDSSTLTLKAGETVLSSPTITFNGVVTFWDLQNAGSTVINGSNITTGTISADRIATNISQVSNILKVGIYGQDSEIRVQTATAGGFYGVISNANTMFNVISYENLNLQSYNDMYLKADGGLILQSVGHETPSYNHLWGTEAPATIFNQAHPPETGQIYFQISS